MQDTFNYFESLQQNLQESAQIKIQYEWRKFKKQKQIMLQKERELLQKQSDERRKQSGSKRQSFKAGRGDKRVPNAVTPPPLVIKK